MERRTAVVDGMMARWRTFDESRVACAEDVFSENQRTAERERYCAAARGDFDSARRWPKSENFARENSVDGNTPNPWYEVILIEGRNRQIRRMFKEIGSM